VAVAASYALNALFPYVNVFVGLWMWNMKRMRSMNIKEYNNFKFTIVPRSWVFCLLNKNPPPDSDEGFLACL
jgi:hypothetical protein